MLVVRVGTGDIHPPQKEIPPRIALRGRTGARVNRR
jgi:hypothetical protein